MTRRELLQLGAAYLGAAILGGIGGITSTERGREPEREEPSSDGGKEPP